MKKSLFALTAGILGLSLVTINAQFGPRGGGPQPPRFDAAMAKLFGDNTAFSATVEMQSKGGRGEGMNMPGQLAFDAGKSRFEMNMASGGNLPPEAVAQMKAMGMDSMVMISRPDKKLSYLVYPGMKAYVEMPMNDSTSASPTNDLRIELTELGKETVDGHDCVKIKATVTDPNGQKHESVIWNAADLKKFPVKIQQSERGNETTMLFKDVKLSKPQSSLFDPPSGFKRYDSMQEMMMKQMGGAPGFPPPGQ
jgi:Domain of unknown function (DUF4412)